MQKKFSKAKDFSKWRFYCNWKIFSFCLVASKTNVRNQQPKLCAFSVHHSNNRKSPRGLIEKHLVELTRFCDELSFKLYFYFNQPLLLHFSGLLFVGFIFSLRAAKITPSPLCHISPQQNALLIFVLVLRFFCNRKTKGNDITNSYSKSTDTSSVDSLDCTMRLCTR